MVDAENLVVDQALDEVEEAPAEEEAAEVEAPGRGQLAALPGTDREESAGHHRDPGAEVEEAVGEGVVLEAADGGCGSSPRR